MELKENPGWSVSSRGYSIGTGYILTQRHQPRNLAILVHPVVSPPGVQAFLTISSVSLTGRTTRARLRVNSLACGALGARTRALTGDAQLTEEGRRSVTALIRRLAEQLHCLGLVVVVNRLYNAPLV